MMLQELIHVLRNFSQLVQGLYIMIAHMSLMLAHIKIIYKALQYYLQNVFSSPCLWAKFLLWMAVVVHGKVYACMLFPAKLGARMLLSKQAMCAHVSRHD